MRASRCTTCALQALMEKYWNDRNIDDFPEGRRGGAVDKLDRAVNSGCPENSAFRDFATSAVQGDPHEFLTEIFRQLQRAEHHSSKRLDRLLMTNHNCRWTCADCSVEQVREYSNLGLELVVRKWGEFDSRSLMDYIRGYHEDSVSWKYDSDACEAARQLESEAKAQGTRGEKQRERKLEITQAPEILCIHLNRASFNETEGATKLRDDVPFLEELDLSDFAEDESSLKYRMYGIVAHRGAKVKSGHYIAAVRLQDGEEF